MTDSSDWTLLWLPGERGVDSFAAFRGAFTLTEDAEVEFRLFGAHAYEAWLDGAFLSEGPVRFVAPHAPEYESARKRLAPGPHLLAARVHDEGVANRLIRGDQVPACFACRIVRLDEESDIPIEWNCMRLEGYASRIRRISPCLGWIEWCDTTKNPRNWRGPDAEIDPGVWGPPVRVAADFPSPQPPTSALVGRFPRRLAPIARGPLAEVFGYETDDIATRFFLRDLECDTLPPQGAWRRYDLGRVRLGRPCFTLDVPAGAVVEFALGEALHHGRVTPCISLSLGPTCNLDHYVARGGPQTFSPLTPKGGRYLEIHVKADPESIRFLDETFLERGYFDSPTGAFRCGDESLDAIWATGVETLRACAEDAIVDTPCRERGQWIGDSLTVGLEIAAVAFSDLRLFRRAIRQSAQAADARKGVAAMASGEFIHLPAYAMQWVNANLRHYELTGDRALLEDMFPYAIDNMKALETAWRENDLLSFGEPNFIDWGYYVGEDGVDLASLLHWLLSVRGMIRWGRLLDRDETFPFVRMEMQIIEIINNHIEKRLETDGAPPPGPETFDWASIGYHATVLALKAGLVPKDREASALDAIGRHILDCFPNNPTAPRLSDPAVRSRRLLTPYFAHFAFPVLIERGRMDFALDQYRACWGWALKAGFTTWPEVFDPRWSHCHHWSGCPTWQLSRYVLGLNPRFDLGIRHYELVHVPGSLVSASGTLPIAGDEGMIAIDWKRRGEVLDYTVRSDRPIWIHPDGDASPERQTGCIAIEPHQRTRVVDASRSRRSFAASETPRRGERSTTRKPGSTP